jgi:NAD(P)-dependent dehydrogenase (short-subunit alcohol dehydrogenase family)
MATDARPVALVTGATSGIGRLSAERLAQGGLRVFGTGRGPQADPGSGIRMLTLDVRSDVSAAECVRAVEAQAGRLDVLVSNAGVAHVSLAEETPMQEARDLFETNFFGTVRMIRSVLPIMRRQRQGRIVVVSSLAGLVGVPGQAYYAASKHALEGYCESLLYELEPLGLHVTLVEPGFQRTALHARALARADAIAAYDGMRERIRAAIERNFGHGGDPARVADAVVRIATSRRPPLRYRVGSDARWVPRLKQWLPQAAFSMGLRRSFGLDGKRKGT